MVTLTLMRRNPWCLYQRLARPPSPQEETARSPSLNEGTLVVPVPINTLEKESPMSTSHHHFPTLDSMTSSETRTQNDGRTQYLVNDVPDSTRHRLLSQKRGPDFFASEEEQTGSRPRKELSESVSFVSAVAQPNESSLALEMSLPCLGDLRSKSGRGYLRPGPWGVSGKLEKERETSNRLACLVTEKAARTAGLKHMRMRWCPAVKDDGTAKARIVLLGFQYHCSGTIATLSVAFVRKELIVAVAFLPMSTTWWSECIPPQDWPSDSSKN